MPDGNGQGRAISAQVMIAEGEYLDQVRADATTYVRRHAVDDLVGPLDADTILDRIDHFLEMLGIDELTLSGQREGTHDSKTMSIRRRAEAKRMMLKRS